MVSEQGVRQLGPIELFASAPAGSDSTWTVEAGGGAEGNFKSQLGIQLEMPHPARESPKATPATPLALPMTNPLLVPTSHPPRTIRGRRRPRNGCAAEGARYRARSEAIAPGSSPKWPITRSALSSGAGTSE